LIPIEPIQLPYYCQLDNAMIVNATHAYVCRGCSRYICPTCFSDMKQSGRYSCLLCGGELEERPAVQLEVNLNQIEQMSDDELENFLEGLFRTLGYRLEHLQYYSDNEINLGITKGDSHRCAQFIRSKASIKIDYNILIQIKNIDYFQSCDTLMVIATSYFTQEAHKYAQENGIELWDRTTLKRYLLQYNQHVTDK